MRHEVRCWCLTSKDWAPSWVVCYTHDAAMLGPAVQAPADKQAVHFSSFHCHGHLFVSPGKICSNSRCCCVFSHCWQKTGSWCIMHSIWDDWFLAMQLQLMQKSANCKKYISIWKHASSSNWHNVIDSGPAALRAMRHSWPSHEPMIKWLRPISP